MKTPLELQDLVADVVHSYPPAQFEFDPLPSGVCFFWLTLNGHSFVLEYHPTQGTGVSENFPSSVRTLRRAAARVMGHERTALAEPTLTFKRTIVDAPQRGAISGGISNMRSKFVLLVAAVAVCAFAARVRLGRVPSNLLDPAYRHRRGRTGAIG